MAVCADGELHVTWDCNSHHHSPLARQARAGGTCNPIISKRAPEIVPVKLLAMRVTTNLRWEDQQQGTHGIPMEDEKVCRVIVWQVVIVVVKETSRIHCPLNWSVGNCGVASVRSASLQ